MKTIAIIGAASIYCLATIAFGGMSFLGSRDWENPYGDKPLSIPVALWRALYIGIGWPVVVFVVLRSRARSASQQ